MSCLYYWLCSWGVTDQWTELLDWNTGLDYWTGIFLVFTHSKVVFGTFLDFFSYSMAVLKLLN